MQVPFTWKPTGWYMIGWSEEFVPGEVRRLRYFGEELVGYRKTDGTLQVMSARCPHLGANIARGGKVIDDCVQCPFHGWVWGPDGVNVEIPYDDKPNRSQRLRVFPILEQHECVFMWHHPLGEPPSWEMPDIFESLPALETDGAKYYRAYPEMSRRSEGEPVHPQIVAENAPDSVHFQYVHHATVTPVALDWQVVGPEWHFLTGWPNARSEDPNAMRLRIHSHLFGLGGAYSLFEGSSNHRLIFAVTPVDDGLSDLFYSIWLPRVEGDDSPAAPPEVREPVEKEFLTSMWDDLAIWRYQEYVEHPALAKVDAKPYMALRKWAQQFYDIEPGELVAVSTRAKDTLT